MIDSFNFWKAFWYFYISTGDLFAILLTLFGFHARSLLSCKSSGASTKREREDESDGRRQC